MNIQKLISRIRNFLHKDMWYHIAYTKNEYAGVVYIDGFPVLNYNSSVSVPYDRFEFGKNDFTVDCWYHFKLFNPKEWNKAQHFAFSNVFRR